MKTAKVNQKIAYLQQAAIALMASGMFMMASCSKEDSIAPQSGSAVKSQLMLREGEVAISIKHGACKDGCPQYDFALLADGWVIYNGYDFVGTPGRQEFAVEGHVVDMLLEFSKEHGFFDFKDQYEYSEGAAPATTNIRLSDGTEKSVSDFDFDIPDELRLIKSTIEEALGITALVTSGSGGGEAPAIRMSRSSCESGCPEYSFSVSAEGKIIYNGVEKVKVTGLVEYEVGMDVVRDLLEFAVDRGIFDLPDEYPYNRHYTD